MKFGNFYRMIEKLESIDHSLVLAINAMHSTFLDSFMWFLSGSYILLLLIPFVFYFLFIKSFQKKTYVHIVYIYKKSIKSQCLIHKINEKSNLGPCTRRSRLGARREVGGSEHFAPILYFVYVFLTLANCW